MMIRELRKKKKKKGFWKVLAKSNKQLEQIITEGFTLDELSIREPMMTTILLVCPLQWYNLLGSLATSADGMDTT